ncbi:MAG: energy transducer TonB [Bacteroidota bacterium]
MNKKKIFRKTTFKKVFLAVPLTIAIVCFFGFTKTLSPDRMPASAYLPGFPVFYESHNDSQQDDKVYTEVKTPPQYPGGQDAMMKFMSENIKYPAYCKKSGKQGTVYVSFVVDKNGKVKDVKALKGVYPSLDAEAIRIVKLMPNWKPGSDASGKVVNVAFTLPVSFKLK